MFVLDVNAPSHAAYPLAREVSSQGRGFEHVFDRLVKGQGASLYRPPSREDVIKLAAMIKSQLFQVGHSDAAIFSSARLESTLSLLKARSLSADSLLPVRHKSLSVVAGEAGVVVQAMPQPPGVEGASTRPKGEGEYAALIHDAAAKYALDPDLIRSVVAVESDFRADAVSPVGAQGLMQLMPETARELGVSDSFDPQQNIDAGSRYLAGLLKRYHGQLPLALAAYNWGMGNVERHPDRMPEETRQYIGRVMAQMNRAQGARVITGRDVV